MYENVRNRFFGDSMGEQTDGTANGQTACSFAVHLRNAGGTVQALLRTCSSLASCAHPVQKRARYHVLVANAGGILDLERCKACGAWHLPGNGHEEWERAELVEQLADEIGPETFSVLREILEAASAAAEVRRGLEALASLLPDPDLSSEHLGHVIDAVRVWHEQSERLAANFVVVHIQRKGRA